MTWRVDKDDGPTLFNRMRGNLLALAGSDRRASRLRALLIDRQPPRVAAAERCSAEQQADEGAQVPGFSSVRRRRTCAYCTGCSAALDAANQLT